MNFVAEQERYELDKFADQVTDNLWGALTVLTYRRGGCFRVTLSVKDGDLTPWGCYGISDIKVTDLDEVQVTFDQHWSRDWCDTCQEAHRISDFGEFCRSDEEYDVDGEGRQEVRTFTIPVPMQEEPKNVGSFPAEILKSCEAWAEQEANDHPHEEAP